MEGLKGGHFGDSWTRLLPPVPLSVTLGGVEGWHCVRIRASCVSAYYMEWEGGGGGTGVSRKSEGREMKEKMKERMTQRGEGTAKGG